MPNSLFFCKMRGPKSILIAALIDTVILKQTEDDLREGKEN